MYGSVVPRRRLAAIGDRLCFRDPKGRSPLPSIVPSPRGLLVRGPCRLLHEFRVSKKEGIRFTDVTRDPNPIHIDDEIVPGALTVSKTMIALEVLFPGCRIRSVRAKFTGAAFYGKRTVSRYELNPSLDGLEARVVTFQGGRTVAKLDISAAVCSEEAPYSGEVDPANLALIRQYLECLNVEGAVFLDARPVEFPLGFLASLPSGEMVRMLKGEGGMLNVLALEFPPDPVTAGVGIPGVELSQKKTRPTFNRILTRITDGFKTFGKGFALVHSGAVFGRT